MATNNSVNSPLSGTTGTGNFVGSLSPSVTNLNTNAIYSSGNYQITFGNSASPVNFLTITNGATGNPVSIQANGTDTNVALYLSGKGSGQVRFGNDLLMYNTAGGNNYTVLTTTANGAKTVTIPDLSGTLAVSGASQNVTFGIGQFNSIYAPNGTGLINPNGVASAVNYWTISNNSTGQPVYMASDGSDASVGQYFITKGDAGVTLQTAAVTASPLTIQSGTSSQHATVFQFSNTAATRIVTFPDASGTVALSGTSQNVTFGTVQATQINDTNGNQIIGLYPIASAVNSIQISNANAGGQCNINTVGADSNINMVLQPKGTGLLRYYTEATANQITVNTGTSYVHETLFQFPTSSASRSVTFPDLTGTVALSGASQNVTFGTVGTSQINDTNGNASLKFNPIPSAVNYLQIDNDVAGGDGPLISCVGSSAAMNLRLAPKNNAVQIQTTNAGGTALRIDTGSPTLQHVTFLQFPLTNAIRAVAFPDADGTVALSGASQNVTFGTVQTSQINDTNGNANLAISATASAVNYMISTNSATGGYTGFEVAGSDTNANAFIKPKGDAGLAVITSAVSASPFAIFSGTGQQHITTFNFSNTSATRALTFPDITGNVNVGAATGGIGAWVNFNGTGTVAIRASSNVTSITDNNVGDYTINFTNALVDADYSIVGTTMYTTAAGGYGAFVNAPYLGTINTTNVRIVTASSSAVYDCAYVSIQIVR